MNSYRNLITGEPAQQASFPSTYFELGIQKTENGFAYGTSEGEFLCAFGSHDSFKEAWFDALTYTLIGGEAYQVWRSWSVNKTAHTNDDQGFDPYAGNLDVLLGY